jgi:predicted dehydrogenase
LAVHLRSRLFPEEGQRDMSLSRRDFLKSVAAGAALAPWLGSSRLSAADAVKVRHASIGASGMALADITSFSKHPAFTLVAVADVDLSRVEKVKERFPEARIYQDWRELLRKERANLDSINVSTPDHMHAPIAMAAMRTGLHVYVQKPLAATIRETRKLSEYAREHALVSQMGIQISSAPSQRAFEAMIRSGAIGKIQEVHTFCDKSWGAEGLLPAVSSPVPPTLDWDGWLGVGAVRQYQDGTYHPAEWRRRVGFGTGTLGDMGCHIFSPPFRALGLIAPISVTSHGPAPSKDNWATKARVHYVYPGSTLTAGRTVDLWWYDGEERPPEHVQALVGDRLPKTGSVAIGAGGALVLPHISDPFLLPADKFSTYERPAIEPRDHYFEFLEKVAAATAMRARTAPQASANFSYAGPLTESVLLGNIAAWYPGETLEWDARGMTVKGRKAAKEHVRRKYRKGWPTKGL